ncbi:MAG: NAD(P)-dependent alcohol dehydrogenase, partial [Ignavibacteriales bacterium]|nr:NAD(P)-dependent alcohol dehydrogenase [Ignavibacteriales bacterium]
IGTKVKQFKPGDEVFGDLSHSGWGGFAEFTCAAENAIALKPGNVSFEEAASAPLAAITALQGLRDKGQIKAGCKVLINGAAGGVGTFAVQIAKAFGAEVTGVCSTKNLGTIKSIGADHVIDYTKENFTEKEQCYDLILAANGYHPISAYKRVLNPRGRYVMVGGSTKQMFQALLLGPFISIAGNKKMGGMLAVTNQNDLLFVKELLESGKVKPVIDRRYTLRDTADAVRYIETGHAKGKIIITM